MWGARAQTRYFALKASNISRVSALRRSGRFKVTTPARSFSSKLTPGASDKIRCLPTRNRCVMTRHISAGTGAIRPAAGSTQSLKPQVLRKRQSPPVMTLKPLAWFTLIVLVALPAAAVAEGADTPSLPQRNPFRAPVEAKPVLPKDQPTIPWTEAEIDAATAKCKELLTEDPLDYELLPPIKEGVCGTPAPVLLRAVGQDPKVVIEPPATLSCPMADVLGEWVRNTVQPEAMKLFGSYVVKIQNASSYVCRNRYNGTHTLLSEHALANAFDVSQLALTNGTRITVLDHWPRVATTSPAAQKSSDRERVVTAAKNESQPVAELARMSESNPFRLDGSASAPPTESKGGERNPDDVVAARAEPDTEPALDPNPFDDPAALAPPAKPQGGDREGSADTAKPEPGAPPPAAAEPGADAKSKFVTYLHEDACRHFGTVLGPNANEAHKDHFHLDMKKRRKSNFCE